MRLKVAFGIALAASLTVLGGCGGPRPVKVTGKVTLNGEPVEGARVQFVPVLDTGKQANGSTGRDGQFELTTVENNDGAIPGDYKVVITYTTPVETGPGESTEKVMKQAMDMQKQAAKKKPKYLIPNEYTSAATTPRTVKVPTDGPVVIDIK